MKIAQLSEELISTLELDEGQQELYESDFDANGSFGLRVNSGGKRSFFTIYRNMGRRKRMTLGSFPSLSIEEARDRARHICRLADRGKDPANDKNATMSFSSLIDEFERSHLSKDYSQSTVREYRRIIRKELLPKWGNRLCSSITKNDIELLVQSIGGPRNSPTMANRVRALCSRIFSFACERAILHANQAQSVKRFETKPRFPKALSIEECKRLYAHLGNEDPIQGTALRIMLLTGQLPSRVLAMRWEDITLDQWRVQGAAEKTIQLSAQCQQLLKSRYRPGAIFVFETKPGKHLSHVRYLCKRIQIDLPLDTIWTPSDLRRSVEIGMRDIGIRLDVIARALNQTTIQRRFAAEKNENIALLAQNAMHKWAREITVQRSKGSKKPSSSGAKVISLFPED